MEHASWRRWAKIARRAILALVAFYLISGMTALLVIGATRHG